MKANLIVTASDRRYGDFLIEHWYASLADSSDLSAIDIVVLDYGLSTAQRYWLEGHGIATRACVRDGHPAVVRYRDLRALLAGASWEQVLLCDSGDIIFQSDISEVFRIEPGRFRAATEDYKPPFSVFISGEFFDSRDRERLTERFVLSPMINGGLVVGPREKMLRLAEVILGTTKTLAKFGPDQIVLNDVLWRDGFYELEKLWNYVVATAKEGVAIEAGVFRTGSGRLPAVVHNAGNLSFLRPVENFGYGRDRNQLKEEVYVALRALYQSTEGLFKTQELFFQSRRRFRFLMRRMLRELGYGNRNSRRT